MSIFSTIEKAWNNFWIQRDGSEELENLTHAGTYMIRLPAVKHRRLNMTLDEMVHDFENYASPDRVATLRSEVSQLKFLLSQAPMHLAPVDKFRKGATQIAFAYIHPKTLAALEVAPYTAMRAKPKSGTQWVPVSLVPEGQVIYSPNPIPGLEKILGR